MIRTFLKSLFICLICTAIYYYMQWHILDADTQDRIRRVLGFLPLIIVSLMGSYMLVCIGMVAVATLHFLFPSLPKRRRTQSVAVPKTLITAPKKRSQI